MMTSLINGLKKGLSNNDYHVDYGDNTTKYNTSQNINTRVNNLPINYDNSKYSRKNNVIKTSPSKELKRAVRINTGRNTLIHRPHHHNNPQQPKKDQLYQQFRPRQVWLQGQQQQQMPHHNQSKQNLGDPNMGRYYQGQLQQQYKTIALDDPNESNDLKNTSGISKQLPTTQPSQLSPSITTKSQPTATTPTNIKTINAPPTLTTATTTRKETTITQPITTAESQFITNFNRRCTILLNETERKHLYKILSDYKNDNNLNRLVDQLCLIFDSPIKMELVDDVRNFVDESHYEYFDKMIPFRGMGSRFVNILSRTPAYNMKNDGIYLASDKKSDETPVLVENAVEAKLITIEKSSPNEVLGFKLWGGAQNGKGVYVSEVIPNSLSDRAGLRAGDCLIDINDKSLQNANLEEVMNFIESFRQLRLHILRLNDLSNFRKNSSKEENVSIDPNKHRGMKREKSVSIENLNHGLGYERGRNADESFPTLTRRQNPQQRQTMNYHHQPQIKHYENIHMHPKILRSEIVDHNYPGNLDSREFKRSDIDYERENGVTNFNDPTHSPSAYITKPSNMNNWPKTNLGIFKSGSYDLINDKKGGKLWSDKFPFVKNIFRSSTINDLRQITSERNKENGKHSLRRTKTVINLTDRPTISMEDISSGTKFPLANKFSQSMQNLSSNSRRFVPSPLLTRRDVVTIPTIRTYVNLTRQKEPQQNQHYKQQQQHETLNQPNVTIKKQQPQQYYNPLKQVEHKVPLYRENHDENKNEKTNTISPPHHQEKEALYETNENEERHKPKFTSHQKQEENLPSQSNISRSAQQQSILQLPQQIYIQIPFDQLFLQQPQLIHQLQQHQSQQNIQQQSPQKTLLQTQLKNQPAEPQKQQEQSVIPESFKQQYPINDQSNNKQGSNSLKSHLLSPKQNENFLKKAKRFKKGKAKKHKTASTNTSPTLINSPQPLSSRHNYINYDIYNSDDDEDQKYYYHGLPYHRSMPDLSTDNDFIRFKNNFYEDSWLNKTKYFYYGNNYKYDDDDDDDRERKRFLNTVLKEDSNDFSDVSYVKLPTRGVKQGRNSFKKKPLWTTVSTDIDSDSSRFHEPLYPSRSSEEVLFGRGNSMRKSRTSRTFGPSSDTTSIYSNIAQKNNAPKKPPRTFRHKNPPEINISPPFSYKENPLMMDSPTTYKDRTSSSVEMFTKKPSPPQFFPHQEEGNKNNSELGRDYKHETTKNDEEDIDSNTLKSSDDIMSYEMGSYDGNKSYIFENAKIEKELNENEDDAGINLLVYNRISSPVEQLDGPKRNSQNLKQSIYANFEHSDEKVIALPPSNTVTKLSKNIKEHEPSLKKIQASKNLIAGHDETQKQQTSSSYQQSKSQLDQTSHKIQPPCQKQKLPEINEIVAKQESRTLFKSETLTTFTRDVSISSSEGDTTISGYYDFNNKSNVLTDNSTTENNYKNIDKNNNTLDSQGKTFFNKLPIKESKDSKFAKSLDDSSDKNSLREVKKLSRNKLIWPPSNNDTNLVTGAVKSPLEQNKNVSDNHSIDQGLMMNDRSSTINYALKKTDDNDSQFSELWESKSYSWSWSNSDQLMHLESFKNSGNSKTMETQLLPNAFDSIDSGLSTVTNESLKFGTAQSSDRFIQLNLEKSLETNQFLPQNPNEETISKTLQDKNPTNNSTNKKQQEPKPFKPVALQRTFNERQKVLKEEQQKKNDNRILLAKLDKNFKILGLSISGGIECKSYPNIIIDKITDNSAAQNEGHLKVGMKLLSVDGKSLLNATHKMAVQMIKSSFVDKTNRWMILEASL